MKIYDAIEIKYTKLETVVHKECNLDQCTALKL